MADNLQSYNRDDPFSKVPEKKKSQRGAKVSVSGLLSQDCSLVPQTTCDKDKDPALYVDQIIENLPGAKYVSSTFSQLAYANGLTIDDEQEDKKLQEFLAEYTPLGITNRDVIYQAMLDSTVYGGALLRFVSASEIDNALYNQSKDFLVEHSPKYFDPIVLKYERLMLEKIIAYEIRDTYEPTQKTAEVSTDMLSALLRNGAGYLKTDDGRFIVDSDSATYPRFYPGYIKAESPFYYDRMRIDLALAALQRNIADLRKDGIGRLILYERQNISPNTITEEAFAGGAAEGSQSAQADRRTDADNIRRLSRDIKNSGTDSVITLDGDRFEDKVDTIPRQVSSSDYITVVEDSVKIACNAYGLPPGMFGVKDTGYQSSVRPLLEFAENNYISPFRNRFADNLNKFLKSKLKLKGVIKFDLLDTTAIDELVKNHQGFISVAKDMVSVGVPLGEVYKYVNDNIGSELDEGDTTRLLATNLTNAGPEVN